MWLTYADGLIKTCPKTIEEIEKISASIEKLNDEIQNEISKDAEIIDKESLNEVIEINDDL